MDAPLVSTTAPVMAPVAPPWPYAFAPKSRAVNRNTPANNLSTPRILIPHLRIVKKKDTPHERECSRSFPNALYRTTIQDHAHESGEDFPALNVAKRLHGVKNSEKGDFR
jgi:hypothetical protein